MPQKGAIDRLPIICAAGRGAEHCESVGDLLQEYPKDEFAEKFIKYKQKLIEFSPGVPATPVIPENSQLREVLAPDLNKSRFLEFKDRFYENLYCKKVPLGKPTPANSKPDHITNESVIFGKVIPRTGSVYEIALPRKTPDEVLREYVKWHDKYRLSHGDYFPSEQITRGYNDKFNAKRSFGRKTNVDVSGNLVKGILQDVHSSKIYIINKAHKEYIEQHKSLLGQPLKRQGNLSDPGTVFGRLAPADEFHVKELLNKNLTPQEITKHASTTTYRDFAADLHKAPVECRGPAGQLQSEYPKKGDCKFFAENLGEETTVKQLISPSIPTHFGLSHRDFLLPRSKDEILRIFTKAGFDLQSPEYFEKVWAAASTEWTSIGGRVSVEAFKYALQKIKN